MFILNNAQATKLKRHQRVFTFVFNRNSLVSSNLAKHVWSTKLYRYQFYSLVLLVAYHLVCDTYTTSIVKDICTCVTCERVRDCSAWRGFAMQYCINTSLVFAASFIWVSHISPNVRFVLRAFILSNWTFNQSYRNWYYFKMYVYNVYFKILYRYTVIWNFN